ncbi:MAG: MFS transporter [Rectinemataceae bacterium]
MTDKRKAAYSFLVLLGVISLFSDLTYEGARSILGPYLLLLGASAATVGFISGLGELIGYTLRLATGIISDRTHRYWFMTIAGYAINLLAVPALALAPGYGWAFACGLIVLERFGKAIRHPAKTTLVSFAANEVGAGKGFALQQVLDQIGAFLGPVMLFAVLTIKEGTAAKLSAYSLGFLLLGIPGLIVIILLVVAKSRYPRPHELESSAPVAAENGFSRGYWFYLVSISLLAAGFADFPLMAFHLILRALRLPLRYADRRGRGHRLVGHRNRRAGVHSQGSRGQIGAEGKEGHVLYGIFYTGFGAFWFLGSWAMGLLYDQSLAGLVAFSVVAQLAALPFFFKTRAILAGEAAHEEARNG